MFLIEKLPKESDHQVLSSGVETGKFVIGMRSFGFEANLYYQLGLSTVLAFRYL